MINGILLYCPPSTKLPSFKSITFPSTFESVSNGDLFSFSSNNHICDIRQIIFKNSTPPNTSPWYVF